MKCPKCGKDAYPHYEAKAYGRDKWQQVGWGCVQCLDSFPYKRKAENKTKKEQAK